MQNSARCNRDRQRRGCSAGLSNGKNFRSRCRAVSRFREIPGLKRGMGNERLSGGKRRRSFAGTIAERVPKTHFEFSAPFFVFLFSVCLAVHSGILPYSLLCGIAANQVEPSADSSAASFAAAPMSLSAFSSAAVPTSSPDDSSAVMLLQRFRPRIHPQLYRCPRRQLRRAEK